MCVIASRFFFLISVNEILSLPQTVYPLAAACVVLPKLCELMHKGVSVPTSLKENSLHFPEPGSLYDGEPVSKDKGLGKESFKKKKKQWFGFF